MDKLPYAVQTDLRYQNDIMLCSRTMAEKLMEKTQCQQGGLITYFKTTDHMAVYEQMQKILKDNGQYFRYSLVDEAMEYESYRSIIYVVKVFSYGFLVLMSQMNNPGKATSVFMVDEFPTILLQGIDTFIRSEEHTSNSSHRCTSRMPSSA